MINNKKNIFYWCLYDFGNSAFFTLVVTFVYATYFTQVISPDEITGTLFWSRGISISAILIAILSPLLFGAWAVALDYPGLQERSNLAQHLFLLNTSTFGNKRLKGVRLRKPI